jgi:hypothetical protein
MMIRLASAALVVLKGWAWVVTQIEWAWWTLRDGKAPKTKVVWYGYDRKKH